MQKQPQQRFPRWLSWVVLIGLGWILFVGNSKQPTPVTPPPENGTAEQPAHEYPQLQALLDGERWKKAINPTYHSPQDACSFHPAENTLGNYAIIETEGNGDAAACGESLVLEFSRWGNDGSLGKSFEATLVLGEQPAMDSVLLGMRPGEQRLLVLRLPERIKAFPLPPKNQLLLRVTRTMPEAPVTEPVASEEPVSEEPTAPKN